MVFFKPGGISASRYPLGFDFNKAKGSLRRICKVHGVRGARTDAVRWRTETQWRPYVREQRERNPSFCLAEPRSRFWAIGPCIFRSWADVIGFGLSNLNFGLWVLGLGNWDKVCK
ncbi:hypothetical protein V6Z11_A05G333500 [Gossypium hirsutum]